MLCVLCALLIETGVLLNEGMAGPHSLNGASSCNNQSNQCSCFLRFVLAIFSYDDGNVRDFRKPVLNLYETKKKQKRAEDREAIKLLFSDNRTRSETRSSSAISVRLSVTLSTYVMDVTLLSPR